MLHHNATFGSSFLSSALANERHVAYAVVHCPGEGIDLRGSKIIETTGALESKDSRFATRVRTYRHGESGKRVVLAGVMHIAQNPEYYPAIQQILDSESAAGAAIHYERVKPATPSEVYEAQPATRYLKRVRRLKALMKFPHLLVEGINVFKQGEAMTYHDHWENHDASIIELARRVDPVALLVVSGVVKIGAAAISQLTPEHRLTVMSSIDPEAQHKHNALFGRLSPAILDYRNDIALGAYDALQAAEPGRSAVLLWGDGHIPGLDEGFMARGFKQIDEQRFTALDPTALALKTD